VSELQTNELTKQQRHVAMNAVHGFKLACRLNALPCGRQFDEYTIRVDALLFVQVDQSTCLVDLRLPIETESRVDFGAHASGNNAKNFFAKQNEQLVHRP
jgi:hypothetical protein